MALDHVAMKRISVVVFWKSSKDFYTVSHLYVMDTIKGLQTLDREVTFRDIILGVVGVLSFFGVLSMILNMSGQSLITGIMASQGNTNAPGVITPPPDGGGCEISTASMEFTITNNTPWWSFWYIVHSTETAYFNVTNFYLGTDITSSPSVTLYAAVGGSVGGQVLNKNGPYGFTSGVNSNGVQYEIFSADVEMVNYAIVYGSNGLLNNMYTNILVDYEVMGNGSILIKYFVSYNNTLTSEQAAFMTITNLLKSFSASGGG